MYRHGDDKRGETIVNGMQKLLFALESSSVVRCGIWHTGRRKHSR